MNVEQIFEILCSDAKSERVKKTLVTIHDLCREQLERGSRDFSIITIARLGENKGVPKAQSIRNKTGEQYRALLHAWQEENPKPQTEKSQTSTFDWVEKINDLTIKYLVYDLITVNKGLTSELQLCKSATKLNIDMRQSAPIQTTSSDALSESERRALRYAIDDEFLTIRGWERTNRGAIVDENARPVFKNGFVSAIEKLISK